MQRTVGSRSCGGCCRRLRNETRPLSIHGHLFRDHVKQLFSALTTIHDTHKVACRDIRPENIMLSLNQERAYLTDFGFAQDLNENTVYQGTLSTASDRILGIIKDARKTRLQVTQFDDLESLAKVMTQFVDPIFLISHSALLLLSLSPFYYYYYVVSFFARHTPESEGLRCKGCLGVLAESQNPGILEASLLNDQ